MVREASVFEVETGAAGSIKTTFMVQESFETPEGIRMDVRYEYFTKKIIYVRFINKNETEADYSQIVADAAGIVVPELNGVLKAEKIAEMKNTYEADERSKDDLIYGWESREIFIRYLMLDEIEEATVSFFPYGMSYEEPQYKW